MHLARFSIFWPHIGYQKYYICGQEKPNKAETNMWCQMTLSVAAIITLKSLIPCEPSRLQNYYYSIFITFYEVNCLISCIAWTDTMMMPFGIEWNCKVFLFFPQILKPSEKKAKYQYGGLNSGRPVTPPRGPPKAKGKK